MQRILRVESQLIWRRYKVYRNELHTEFEERGWDATRLEMYHWLGAYDEDIEPEVGRGFDTARANLAFNMYGLGLYFGGSGPAGQADHTCTLPARIAVRLLC